MKEKLRAWWFHKQGLDGSLTNNSLPFREVPGVGSYSPQAVLDMAGWSRSVGGSGPYLSLFARAGTSRADADAAVVDLSIHELPSARGCTYVLPKNDFALGLRVAQGFADQAQIAQGKKYFAVTDDEVDRLCAGIIDALADGPLDPAGLKDRLGDLVRNFGEEGKKRGLSNSLPLATSKLQTHGRIRRVPINGRLDQQKYAYTLWDQLPYDSGVGAESPFTDLARRFYQWTGPASTAQFQWFSGLGVKAANDALAPLGLIPIAPGSDLLISPDEMADFEAFTPPSIPHYALISSMDSLLLLRRDIASLVDDADLERRVTAEKGLVEIGRLSDFSSNVIVDRGRVIGFWEYDTAAKEIVWSTFTPQASPPFREGPGVGSGSDLAAIVQRMQTFITTDLGDARSFSLDSPASRRPRIDALRNPSW